MALGLGKKSAERLGIKLSDINRIDRLAPYNYWDWQGWREEIQEHFPKTDEHFKACFNIPKRSDCIMLMFNELLEGFGVEGLPIEGEHIDSYYYNIVADYVNMGDTYDTTVLKDNATGKFIVTSWGDFIETKYPNY